MNKRKLKQFVVPTIYTCAISLFVLSMYFVSKIFNISKFDSNEDMEYVDKEIVTDNEYIPVVIVENTIMKPYLDNNVTISRTFYDYKGEAESQEKSIIEYQGTYMQNSGVDYQNKESFDIVSILDGTVIEVSDNEILGKTIKIRHSNDLISTYQSLSEITVSVDDTISRGQTIGKSGTSPLYSTDSNLHFELSYQGKNINPESSYDKREDELQA